MNKLIKQAFTLIELLVVIAIVGILSGLIVVSMSGVTQKANIAKAQVFSNSLRNSLMINLISEWKFDNDASDSWGDNDGTITGAVSNSDCVYDKCLSFAGAIGAPQHVTITSASSYASLDTPSKTVGVWFNPVSGGEAQKSIVGKFHWNGTNSEQGYDIYLNSSSTSVYAAVADATKNRVGVGQSGIVVPGKWFYVVMTHDNSITVNNLKLYINGVLYDYKSVTGYSAATFLPLSMGRESYYNYFYYLGKIDEVRYYNAVVSGFKIKEYYYSGLNMLFAEGKITQAEYQQRVRELTVAQN
ncbi:MAG: LamG-like jellyroll fold domain-containing protein [Candidatus Paceibacterota bacterium]|jgi:prepilin-type N-terminal cleavage/methylation domain-containing protein